MSILRTKFFNIKELQNRHQKHFIMQIRRSKLHVKSTSKWL